ncbi:hypothetical protein WJX81_002401 [Elliptochloris bilobata]|uniref:Uncharacterized protein n=1 Tax=Elliptochloris bilobata TaxID=381761 RepID=A0AAW1S4G9_9CHLO
MARRGDRGPADGDSRLRTLSALARRQAPAALAHNRWPSAADDGTAALRSPAYFCQVPKAVDGCNTRPLLCNKFQELSCFNGMLKQCMAKLPAWPGTPAPALATHRTHRGTPHYAGGYGGAAELGAEWMFEHRPSRDAFAAAEYARGIGRGLEALLLGDGGAGVTDASSSWTPGLLDTYRFGYS